MFILGIAGGTCSGKTTLASVLEEKLSEYSVKTIHLDKYFKKPTPFVTAPITGIVYPEHNHPDSFELERFMSDFNSADDCDLLIVEGLLILHLPQIREKLDLKLFVDLPSDERLVRRIKRFMQNSSQTLDEVSTRYLDTVRYRHDEFVEPSRWHADLVINGGFGQERGANMIAELIKNKIEGDR